jgi:hypothetical protein
MEHLAMKQDRSRSVKGDRAFLYVAKKLQIEECQFRSYEGTKLVTNKTKWQFAAINHAMNELE